MACDDNKRWEFVFGDGSTMVVSDELLDTKERARQRAESEMLKNGYVTNTIQFRSYRTDLRINDIVTIDGLPYLIKSINYTIDAKKIVATYTAARYER